MYEYIDLTLLQLNGVGHVQYQSSKYRNSNGIYVLSPTTNYTYTKFHYSLKWLIIRGSE